MLSTDTPFLSPTPDTLSTDTPFPADTPVPTHTPSPTPDTPPTDTPFVTLPAPGLIHDLQWSSDGSQLAIAAGTDIHLYDANFAEQHTIPLGVWTERLAFYPSRPILGAALKDGSVRFWDGSGSEICKFTAHTKGATSLSMQGGGNLLATTGNEIVSRIWDISSVLAGGCKVKPVGQMIGSSYTAPDVSFSANGEMVALVDIKDIYVHNSQTRKLIVILHGDLAIFDIALSPDGHWLAAAQNNATVTLWDLSAKPKPTFTLLHIPLGKPKAYTWRVDFDSTSHQLAAATSSGELIVWQLPTLQPVFSRSLGRPISGLAFNPVTSLLTVGTLDGFVYNYSIK